MAAPRKIDYERVEPQWRAGIKSPAQLACEYTKATGVSVSHVAIIKHFKKLGVPRDLSAKVRAKADAMVMQAMVTGKVSSATTKRDAEIIEGSAAQSANIQVSHRSDISKARSLVLTLLAELETVSSEQLTIEALQDLVDKAANPNGDEAMRKILDKARDALSKAISLPARAGTIKALSDSLKTLVTLEREAWGLGSDRSKEESAARQVEDMTDDELLRLATRGSGRQGTADPKARTH